MSVGTPTVTSQGTRRAVAKPFTRSTLSSRAHVDTSLPSFAAHALLQVLPVDLLADQLLLDEIPCNDDAALVDDVDHATRGQRVKLQYVLGSDRATGPTVSTARIRPVSSLIGRARLRISMSAPHQDRLSDRGSVIGHRLAESSCGRGRWDADSPGPAMSRY